MTEFNQTPVLFGPARSLMGMITTPLGREAAPVGCLLLNMGANHRVGPHRINVKVAHALASHGISNVRFDLGGLGDSAPTVGSDHYLTQAIHDIQSAMDMLQQKLGIRKFLIAGLCSGAVNAMATAVVDQRVIGISMFDGYAFPNRRSRWERTFWRALAAPANPAFLGKAKRGMKRTFARLGGRLIPNGFGRSKAIDPAENNAPLNILDPDISPELTASLFRRSMTELAERKVAIHMVYSGTLHVRDRHRDQLGSFSTEPFTKNVRYEFIREIDHTFTTLLAQQLFVKSITDWGLAVVAEHTVRVVPGPVVIEMPDAPAAAARPHGRAANGHGGLIPR